MFLRIFGSLLASIVLLVTMPAWSSETPSPDEMWRIIQKQQQKIEALQDLLSISEKKNEVIGKVVKSEDISVATQLFTPNWIAKYLLQNSLGRQWMATYPNSTLKANMEFYIDPGAQTPEVDAILAEITPDSWRLTGSL